MPGVPASLLAVEPHALRGSTRAYMPRSSGTSCFSSRTVEQTGIRSIVAYRLYLSSRHRAALCFHSDSPYAFDQIAISTGAIFAAFQRLHDASRQLGR